MGFFTIFVPDGLSESDYARALKCSTGFISTRRRNHQDLLAAAGFSQVEEIDLTSQFLVTQRGWHDGRERFHAELIEAEGEDAFAERQLDAEHMMEGIKAGLLRRALFLCT